MDDQLNFNIDGVCPRCGGRSCVACDARVASRAEHEFTVKLEVRVRCFGLPEVHKSNIIAKVNREMHLAFGDNADVEVIEVTPNRRSWVFDPKMVET